MDNKYVVEVVNDKGESFVLDETNWLAGVIIAAYKQRQDPNYEQREKHFKELREAVMQLEVKES